MIFHAMGGVGIVAAMLPIMSHDVLRKAGTSYQLLEAKISAVLPMQRWREKIPLKNR